MENKDELISLLQPQTSSLNLVYENLIFKSDESDYLIESDGAI